MTLRARSRRSLCGGWKRFKGAFLPLSPLFQTLLIESSGSLVGHTFPIGSRLGGDEDQDDFLVQHFDHNDYDAMFNMKMMVRRSCMRTNKMLDQVRRVALPYPAPLNNIGQGHEHSGV